MLTISTRTLSNNPMNRTPNSVSNFLGVDFLRHQLLRSDVRRRLFAAGQVKAVSALALLLLFRQLRASSLRSELVRVIEGALSADGPTAKQRGEACAE